MDIKKIYKEIGLSVPFEEFNAEFDIQSIEDGYVPKQIAALLNERFEKYRKIIEEYVQADGNSVAVLTEIKVFDDDDKTLMNNLFKELIQLEHAFNICELKNSGFEEFIVSSYATWISLKSDLKTLLLKAKESWKNVENVHEELGYLG